MPVTFRWPHRL